MCGFGWFSTRRRACFAMGRLERRLQIKDYPSLFPSTPYRFCGPHVTLSCDDPPRRRRGLTRAPSGRHFRRDGSRKGSKGNAVRALPYSAAAPATVSGEVFVTMSLELGLREDDEDPRPASQETCRRPWSHASTRRTGCSDR